MNQAQQPTRQSGDTDIEAARLWIQDVEIVGFGADRDTLKAFLRARPALPVTHELHAEIEAICDTLRWLLSIREQDDSDDAVYAAMLEQTRPPSRP